jgi:hypothetical protein
MLLEEKDKRIEDMRRETETLSAFAHYFKSIENRRLEASTEERKSNPGARRKAHSEPGRGVYIQGREGDK